MSTTKTTKTNTPIKKNEDVIKINDLSNEDVIFTEPKMNSKTNNMMASILNASTKRPLLIETAPHAVIYQPNDYQGNKKFSVTIKNITNIEGEKDNVKKLFDFCEDLNEKGINYLLENKKSLLKPKEASKLTRDIAESPAYFGPCMNKDSRDEDQIKLNIMKDYDASSDVPNLFIVIEKSNDIGNGKIEVVKEHIKWSDHEDPWEKLKDVIRPGMHIQCVIQPRIYFVNSKVGINFKLHALKVTKTSKNVNDIEAKDLDIDEFGFSEPKQNKDGRMSSLVLNTKNGTVSGKIICSYHRVIYGVSKYESQGGTSDYSIYIKNETDIPQEQEGVNNMFEFSNEMNTMAIDFIMEHKDILFKPKEAKKMTRELAESAYFNPLVGTDKEGTDQIKLKIMKTMEGDLPNFNLIEEIIGEGDKLTRNEVDWKSFDEPWEELRKLVRPGMHIKPIVQPRIYIVNNKVGINYRLVELIVQKMPQKRFNASSYSFSGDDATATTTTTAIETDSAEEEDVQEEEEIVEGATEETEELVEEEEDPEAYGIDSDEEDVDAEAESDDED